MDTLAIISRRPPYGFINSAEAVRHALGAGDEFVTKLILIDNGVYLAKKGQNMGASGFSNLEEALGLAEGLEIFVEKMSIELRGLKEGELIDGVKVVSSEDISEILTKSYATMIF